VRAELAATQVVEVVHAAQVEHPHVKALERTKPIEGCSTTHHVCLSRQPEPRLERIDELVAAARVSVRLGLAQRRRHRLACWHEYISLHGRTFNKLCELREIRKGSEPRVRLGARTEGGPHTRLVVDVSLRCEQRDECALAF
jgi:hypothetical protein